MSDRRQSTHGRPASIGEEQNGASHDHMDGALDFDQRSPAHHGHIPPPNMTDDIDENELSTRPRLTREQVWLLEKQFQIHHKPNSNIKRQLAETTGLSLQRVANWFQNRRAKAKQQRRQEEYEVLRSLETAGQPDHHEPSSPDVFFPPDFFAPDLGQQQQQQQQQQHLPATGFVGPQPNGFMDIEYRPTQYEFPAEASYASLSRSLAAAAAALAQGAYDGEDPKPAEGSMEAASNDPAFDQADADNDSDTVVPASANWPSVGTLGEPFVFSHGAASVSQLVPHGHQYDVPPLPHGVCSALEATGSHPPTLMPTFVSPTRCEFPIQQGHPPQQGITTPQQGPWPPQSEADAPWGSQDAFSRRGSCSSDLIRDLNDIGIGSQQDESPEIAEPSSNIAARRKRPRPAAIGTAALRATSYMSALPVSPTAKSNLLGSAQSVRRVKSTGNNLNVRGRIQKSIPASAQRSPLHVETFADAAALRSANIHTSLRSARTCSESMPHSSSLAPPTPLSPADMGRFLSNASSDLLPTDPYLVYSPEYISHLAPGMEFGPNLVSPPTTPNYAGMQAYRRNMSMMEYSMPSHPGTQLPMDPRFLEESLLVPQVTSIPPQVHMPQPMYASPISCGDPDMANMLRPHGGGEQRASNKTTTDSGSGGAVGTTFIPEVYYQDKCANQAPVPGTSKPSKPKNYIFVNHTPEEIDS
ncbi:MAG: hypothetical protein M1817_001595 [Caeruleum heppii]|nr:MAG: hypothetical protein M1817_001595 [Caeruleum heppii]